MVMGIEIPLVSGIGRSLVWKASWRMRGRPGFDQERVVILQGGREWDGADH